MFHKIFVTLFFAGHVSRAPGTFASALAVLAAYFLLPLVGQGTFAALIFALFVLALKSIDAYQRQTARQDPSEIVIDELIGMWIALSFIPFGIFEFALGFLYFRAFDIYKPSVIGRVDRKYKNAFGVLLDDCLAGFFAGLGVLLSLKILHELGVTL